MPMEGSTRLFGMEELQLHLEYLRLAVKRMPKGISNNLNFHGHSCSEVAIITSSGAKTLHWANGKCHHIVRGDVLLLHPGIVHSYEYTKLLALTNILYSATSLPIPPLDGCDLPFIEPFFNTSYLSQNPERPILHLEEAQLRKVLNLTVQFEQQLAGDKPGKHLCAFGLFLAMFVEIARAGGNLQNNDLLGSLATPALQFLNLHFNEDVKMDYLASICHLSVRTFYRHFMKLTGYSPRDYMLNKRLEHARQMLASSNSSLKYIAECCGFCDTSHFIAMFSKKYGMPPGRFHSEINQL